MADQRLNLVGRWDIPAPGAMVGRRQPTLEDGLEVDGLEEILGDPASSMPSSDLPAGAPATTSEHAESGGPLRGAPTITPAIGALQNRSPVTGVPPVGGSSTARAAIAGEPQQPPSLDARPSRRTPPREPAPPAGDAGPVTPRSRPPEAGRRSTADGRSPGAATDDALSRTAARGSVVAATEAAAAIEDAAGAIAAPAHRAPATPDGATSAVVRGTVTTSSALAGRAPAPPDGAGRAAANPPTAMQALGEALSKINAWMNRPAEPRSAELAQAIVATPARSPATPADAGGAAWIGGDRPSSVSAPRLSIGHLEVEVVPPPPEPARAPAPRAQRGAPGSTLSAAFAAAEIAKLSFGTRGR
jgi:hypothetical protein